MNIPETFSKSMRAEAERLLAAEPDTSRHKRIINQISEETWRRDRLEWRAWMNEMRAKFAKKIKP